MYIYDEYDQRLVDERVAQFRDQTERFLAGELIEDEYRPLRLMNGLYIQRQAPMLRVAIPYGLLNTKQVRMLAHIARKYDRGYGHISTRQNIQFNWPTLESVPDILEELASVQMHAIQTSGNCIRNTTTDPLCGVAQDEIADARPYCEIIRQWSTFHPEFTYLPRKFKIAVSGSKHDRAAVRLHDIGLFLEKNDAGEMGFRVEVGGGQGRTPVISKPIRNWLPQEDLLTYLEAILRVYNQYGRRDNKYKARIKILVNATGIDTFREQVEAEWNLIKDSGLKLTVEEIQRVSGFFTMPDYDTEAVKDASFSMAIADDKKFATWVQYNTENHKQPGYRAVYVSLKAPTIAPGDITDSQLDAVADIADEFNFGEVQTTYDQNLILANVAQGDLFRLWQKLDELGLATANIGTLTDMICCPGLEFCSLANAGSIDVAETINKKFDDLDYLHDLGEIRLKMSGCMNACGHHHVGHIGILGVDKKGEEWYQITLGGDATENAALGDRIGRAIEKEKVADTLGDLLDVYVENRNEDERFVDTYRRLGIEPFKQRVYG